MEDEKDLYLVYVKQVGENIMGFTEYEFLFSHEPETVWGTDWEQQCPAICGDLTPDESTYDTVKRLKTQLVFNLAQDNTSFSMQDCMDHIFAIAHENINDYDEYPSPYRIVLNYGMPFEEVDKILSGRQQFFSD